MKRGLPRLPLHGIWIVTERNAIGETLLLWIVRKGASESSSKRERATTEARLQLCEGQTSLFQAMKKTAKRFDVAAGQPSEDHYPTTARLNERERDRGV